MAWCVLFSVGLMSLVAPSGAAGRLAGLPTLNATHDAWQQAETTLVSLETGGKTVRSHGFHWIRPGAEAFFARAMAQLCGVARWRWILTRRAMCWSPSMTGAMIRTTWPIVSTAPGWMPKVARCQIIGRLARSPCATGASRATAGLSRRLSRDLDNDERRGGNPICLVDRDRSGLCGCLCFGHEERRYPDHEMTSARRAVRPVWFNACRAAIPDRCPTPRSSISRWRRCGPRPSGRAASAFRCPAIRAIPGISPSRRGTRWPPGRRR